MEQNPQPQKPKVSPVHIKTPQQLSEEFCRMQFESISAHPTPESTKQKRIQVNTINHLDTDQNGKTQVITEIDV